MTEVLTLLVPPCSFARGTLAREGPETLHVGAMTDDSAATPPPPVSWDACRVLAVFLILCTAAAEIP